MNAIYGYIIAALLVVAAIAGGVGYWQGGKHATTAAELAMSEHLAADRKAERSEEHTSELQSLMRNSYAVFCLKKTIHSLLQLQKS